MTPGKECVAVCPQGTRQENCIPEYLDGLIYLRKP
jgi:hypothetical protein